MSKKSFKEDIRKNQKMNGLNYRYFRIKSTTTEENTTNKKNKNNKKVKKMKEISLMAFAAPQQTKEAIEFKQYIGVGAFTVLAICPDKKTLDQIYGGDSKEPVYVSTVERDGIQYKQARIDVILKSYDENINTIFKKSFFITDNKWIGKNTGKIRVIDKYGRTAWATEDDINNKRIPVYSNGPANIDQDYRPSFIGEEALTNFLKIYCAIPSVTFFKDGEMKTISNPSKAEARLDHIKDYFNGNFSELQQMSKYAEGNKIKCLVGIKTTDNGTYPDIYDEFISMASTQKAVDKLEKSVNDAKAVGRYANTEFNFEPIHEYKVTETDFKELKQKAQDDIDGLPF